MTPITSKPDVIRLWIVEDFGPFRSTITRLLKGAGDISCLQSLTNVESALRLLNSEDPPDLILLDINLPGINGIDGIKKFRQIAPHVMILILTTFEENRLVSQAILAGANGYLLKTSSLEQITTGIREVFQGGAPMSPSIAKKTFELIRHISRAYDNEPQVTSRERDVLKWLSSGKSMSEISTLLGISYHTVDFHLRNIYTKFRVGSATAAVAKAIRLGLVE